jgi:hypothetical protein
MIATNQKRKKSNVLAVIVTTAVFAVLAFFVGFMLNRATAITGEEALSNIQNSVIRAVVSCYAFEGFYPDSIDYLVEHYNLLIDFDRYVVHYGKFADNIIPSIVVAERGG